MIDKIFVQIYNTCPHAEEKEISCSEQDQRGVHMKNLWQRTFRQTVGKQLLSVILCLFLISSFSIPASAAQTSGTVTKTSVTRAIAIVFDNSGSMYTGQGNMRWCQAIYAMEVFASMMNSGDVLQIYPMNSIKAGGASYDKNTPLEITSAKDAYKIRDIYSNDADNTGTPIETIPAAFNGLSKKSADEKWLIVLTDGDTFHENNISLDQTTTLNRLSEELTACNESVNVMYLGIGTKNVPTINGSYAHYGTTADSAEVPAELSNMCNMIFGRDELPKPQYLNTSDNSLNFDVPMGKLILFVQGENVSDITLRDANGNAVNMVSSYAAKYSEAGHIKYPGAAVDTSLQGMIATYENCAAGNYTLSYSGNGRSVVAYYEPDVDLDIYLTDEYGQRVDKDNFYPGTVRLTYGMTDSAGNLVNSSLLGNTNYEISYTLNGETKTIQDTGAGFVELDLGETDTIELERGEVTFLGGYRIVKTSQNSSYWRDGIQPKPRPVGTLELAITGGAGTYGISQMEDQGVYELAVTYDGKRLTGAELGRVTMDIAIDGGNVRYDLEQTDNGYLLKLKHAGATKDTTPGEYTINASAVFVNEYLVEVPSEAKSVSFVLEDEVSALGLRIDRPQRYYVISKVADGKTIRVSLTMDGEALTEEQMANVSFKAEADGINLITERVAGESAYIIRIDPNGELESGTHKIRITATGVDKVGREVTVNDDTSVELQRYPVWLRWLIILLALAIPAALVWLFMDMKVLPKDVGESHTAFNVAGSKVAGKAKVEFDGKNKRKGTLTIYSPKFAGNPLIKGGVRLDLEAISPRRTKSSRRAILVTGVTPLNPGAVTGFSVGPAQFTKKAGKKFVKVGAGENSPIEIRIANNARISVKGEFDDDSFSFSVNLVYY